MRSRIRVRASGCADGHDHAQIRFRGHHVLQSGDRRTGQGPAGSRDRRDGWTHGCRRRRRRHPVPTPQSAKGTRGPRSARPGRPQAVQTGHSGDDPQPAESAACRRRGGRAATVRIATDRRRPGRRNNTDLCRPGDHDWNVPPRFDPHRRTKLRCRPDEREGVVRSGSIDSIRRICHGSPKDGYPTAAGWQDDRLDRAGDAGWRRRTGSLLPDDHQHSESSDRVRNHPYDGREPT